MCLIRTVFIVYVWLQGQTVFDLCDPELDDYLEELKEKQATVSPVDVQKITSKREIDKHDQSSFLLFGRRAS